MNRVPIFAVILALISISFLACGYSSSYYKPPSGLATRVFASQSISSPTSGAGLVIINGANDTLARASGIGAGRSPGLMAISPERSTLLVFDSGANSVQVVNTKTETLTGAIQLAGPTTSMVAPTSSFGYAAVPTAVLNASAPGAIEVLNLTIGGVASTLSVPNAQTVVASPSVTQLLVFSSDSDSVTIVSPFSLNTGNPVATTVAGFDRPVNAVFGGDGTAYILNCGPECGSASASASVQILNLGTTPSAGASLAVDGATIALISGSTLYVAGTPTASVSNSSPNNLCPPNTTAAPTCGRLDIVDLSSMTVTGSAVITDGYHDRIDMSNNGQLFIGSHACSTVGNVNAPQGEVRGCLSIFNTVTAAVVIP
ncbi:MAG: hypothetical protein QOF94_2039, partial [Acidobacteriaceae bacterium]